MSQQQGGGWRRDLAAGDPPGHLHAGRQRGVNAAGHLLIQCQPLGTAGKGGQAKAGKGRQRQGGGNDRQAAAGSVRTASNHACRPQAQQHHPPAHLCSAVLLHPSMALCRCSRHRHARCASSSSSSGARPEASSRRQATLRWSAVVPAASRGSSSTASAQAAMACVTAICCALLRGWLEPGSRNCELHHFSPACM